MENGRRSRRRHSFGRSSLESIIVKPPTFAVVAADWYSTKRRLSDKTREGYETALGINGRGNSHRLLRLVPRFGRMRVNEITVERVAQWIRQMESAGFSGAWIANHIKPLNGVMALAVRRGYIPHNPVTLLSPDERPAVAQRELRLLSYETVAHLVAASERLAARPTARYDYSPILRMAIYTGCRLGELLGLKWEDVDFKSGVLHVRWQMSQRGKRIRPKTRRSIRDVVLAPELLLMLREHRLRSPFSADGSYVFASHTGSALSHRNVQARGFDRAVSEAGLLGPPKPVFHDLRHVYASLMIERGITATELCDQMGHSNPGITERRYIHLFNRLRTSDRLRAAVQSAWQVGKSLASTDGT